MEDDITDEIDQFQTASFDLDIRVDKVNVTQDLDPAFSYDFNERHLYMAQPLENQTFDKSEKRASLVNAKNKYISEATGSISTRKVENVKKMLNFVINQARSVFDGSIEIVSDMNIIESEYIQ